MLMASKTKRIASRQEAVKLFAKEQTQNPLASMAILPKDVNFESQNRDEDVYILLRQHWVVNVPWITNLLIGILVPYGIVFVLSLISDEYEFVSSSTIIALWISWYLLLGSYSIMNFLKWFFNAYIVTNERILDIDFYGLLNHRLSEAALENIEDVSSGHVGIWQNLFDFGHVKIQTAAETLEFRFDNVPKPGYVQDKIMDLADIARGAYDNN